MRTVVRAYDVLGRITLDIWWDMPVMKAGGMVPAPDLRVHSDAKTQDEPAVQLLEISEALWAVARDLIARESEEPAGPGEGWPAQPRSSAE